MTTLPRDKQLELLEQAVERCIVGLANGNMDVREAEAIIKGAEVFLDLIDTKEGLKVRRERYERRGS